MCPGEDCKSCVCVTLANNCDRSGSWQGMLLSSEFVASFTPVFQGLLVSIQY